MIVKIVDIVGFTPRAEKSVTLRITTAFEQTDQKQAELLSLYQKRCIIAIKPEETPFQDSELKELDSVDMDLEDTSKTPSKRLRNTLWRLQEKELGKEPTDAEFKDYYKTKMERIITHFKDKLD